MYFDKLAREWDNEPGHAVRNEALANEILRFLEDKSVKSAFEYGCATGALSIMLKDRFESITMADNSSGMIEVLQQKLQENKIEHLHAICLDLEKNVPQFTADVIYTAMTMHHISDLPKLFYTFGKLLNDSGFLVIADLVEEDGSFHWHIPEFDGHKGFSREILESMLVSCHFTVEYYSEYYTIQKKDVNGLIKHYPLFVVVAKKQREK